MPEPSILAMMPTAGRPDLDALNALDMEVCKAGLHRAPLRAIHPRDASRNRLTRAFLDTGFSHLLFVDDDTVIPEGTVEKLLAADKPVICGIQPLWMCGHRVANVAIMRNDEGKPVWPVWSTWPRPAEPFEIVACGFGCILIRREVFESYEFPWFVENNGNAYGQGNVTEDIYFCKHAAAAGYALWAHPGVICGHRKTLDLLTWAPLTETQARKEE